MNGIVFVRLNRPPFINGLTNDVEYAPHHTFTDRHGYWFSGISNVVATLETLGRGHGHGAHPIITEMLLHFENQFLFFFQNGVIDSQRVVDTGKCIREFHIHYGSDHLKDFSFIHAFNNQLNSLFF